MVFDATGPAVLTRGHPAMRGFGRRQMKLHYDPLATSARSVTFFLFDQGIPFEERLVSLELGDQHAPDFAALNPNRQVPVLEDEGFVLTQSAAILRYVADRVSSPAYPTEPRARARVNEAMDWFATGLHLPYCVFLSYRRLLPALRALAAVTQAEMEALGQAMAARYLSVLDGHMLAGRPFICGDEVTIADYLGFSHVTLGEAVAFDLGPYPNIGGWLGRMKARPGYDAAYAAFRGFVDAAPPAAARAA